MGAGAGPPLLRGGKSGRPSNLIARFAPRAKTIREDDRSGKMNKATLKKLRWVQWFDRILLVIIFVAIVAALFFGLSGYIK